MDNNSSVGDGVTKPPTVDEAAMKRVRFNVGGHIYEVSRDIVMANPDTMLARISSESWQADPTKEVFINGDGDRFRHVLDYLRTGRIILPASIPMAAILKDLEYYGFTGVDETHIDNTYLANAAIGPHMVKTASEVAAKASAHKLEASYALISLRCFQGYCMHGNKGSINVKNGEKIEEHDIFKEFLSAFEISRCNDVALFDKHLTEYGFYFISKSWDVAHLVTLGRLPRTEGQKPIYFRFGI